MVYSDNRNNCDHSGVIASIFATSRMLAMLTRMKEVPHKHFGLPGNLRIHAMIYRIVFAMTLIIFFDLRRIASLGAIFYILMDIAIHWGLLSRMKGRIQFNRFVVWTAIFLDSIVLAAFLWIKAQSDMLVIYTSAIGIGLIVIAEIAFMKSHTESEGKMHMEMDE